MAKKTKSNPHTSEYMVITSWTNESKVKRTAQGLVDKGFASNFEIRRTKEGKKEVLGVKLFDVPESKLGDGTIWMGERETFTPSNEYIIKSKLERHGDIVGSFTHSRSNNPRRRKNRPDYDGMINALLGGTIESSPKPSKRKSIDEPEVEMTDLAIFDEEDFPEEKETNLLNYALLAVAVGGIGYGIYSLTQK
jgi:hypothetical protein